MRGGLEGRKVGDGTDAEGLGALFFRYCKGTE